jgi:acyl carrier protein
MKNAIRNPSVFPGELCIAGAGLARGYLNRPELTAEKFIGIELFGKTERIYKTGDLARWLPDGDIEFVGRIDHQVKLRGFRIDLGEIESGLGQYHGINEVVVAVREDQPGDKRLVAYLTHSQEEQPNVNAMRLFLKEKLPGYMIPSAFVLLDKFPLTPNGKIERKALPVPEQTRSEYKRSYVPPRSPIEEMLVVIWREVLAIDSIIGIHDNFFELGGHSLLAMQLIVRINKRFQINFPLSSLFEEPTVAMLAVRLETLLKQENTNAIAPIKALPRKR